ncbi:MAG: hypothetical protein ACRETP_04945, partial [Steroidobacteraceae bacterium]
MHPDLEQQQAVAYLLRELPDAGLRPYDWSEFQHRAQARPAPGKRIAGVRALAAAVLIAVAVCAAAIRLA